MLVYGFHWYQWAAFNQIKFYNIWGFCISFQNCEKNLSFDKPASKHNCVCSVCCLFFSPVKILKDSLDFELWHLKSLPEGAQFIYIKTYTSLNLHVFQYDNGQSDISALPQELMNMFFPHYNSQTNVKHFLRALANNISRFIPRAGICLAIG